MPVNRTRVREALKAFNFEALLIEELGWDRHQTQPFQPLIDGQQYKLTAIAEKRGLAVFLCDPLPDGSIPDYANRRKIENQVRRVAHEHLIIYTDEGRNIQVWQWVRREPGKPAACREHQYHAGQAGDPLIQKLEAISFSLEEEDALTIATVAGRTRQAFDVDRVTKRFFDRFKTEHTAFLNFIKGIQSQGDREWYASLMLNRLMFVYFIQKKGFLDGDTNYLRNRLQSMRERKGKDQFLSFYRHFLLRLFHEGLGQQKHSSELDVLVGKVPYLNGGLFDVHQLERENTDIEVTDEAFEKIFDFFDAYQWHLDERPLRSDTEINPDVLGYIFEKYINQKQMGAYYTKEDITEYIAKNTLVPRLLEAAREECEIAFRKGAALWRMLRDDPDRYIYPPARYGTDNPLPAELKEGLSSTSARAGWNKTAPSDYGLPTETWREHIARRQRYEAMKENLASGEMNDVNKLLTLNLNIRQFAQDVVENAEGPELVRAIYQAIERVTVLDPTCGSGAFLFAALNVLEPLYEACLERMRSFIEEEEHAPGDKERRGQPFKDFKRILAQVAEHPNRRYFILKSIVINNLYGVDIMEEAVEICKLRLFLKLVAQVERVEDIEPLPDIDFNIRAGNTLVGFIDYDEVKQAIRGETQTRLDLGGDMERIDESAEIADRAFDRFREMQVEHGMDAQEFGSAKAELRRRLNDLSNELDRYLASEYGIDSVTSDQFKDWKSTHQPFHWFVEFYGIVKRGGFDVVIGNPPYVEYSKVRQQYKVRNVQTMDAGNLYAYIVERSFRLQSSGARFGMIIQLSAFCTPRMLSFQNMWFKTISFSHLSFFDDRPGKLFDGLEHIRVAIALGVLGSTEPRVATTRYIKFATEERPILFDSLWYQVNETARHGSSVLKISAPTENSFAKKLWSSETTLSGYLQDRENENFVYYGYGFGYWGKVLNFKSFFKGERVSASTGDKYIYCREGIDRDVITALMNSTLFYWFYVNYSDGHNFTKHVIGSLPFRYPATVLATGLKEMSALLMADLQKNARRKIAVYRATGRVEYDEFVPKLSKPLIDKVDAMLAEHYGFTNLELDFITNYDIKYRLGSDAGEDA